ncbi:YbaB/EbfC family nucleoid-associated protein [Glycomyces sp. YM15]|uniref:YbaB/EbfC family nucleoid-associated protein n=1 Tax=Glycomyces sp. YM15 TaxID=2800446 RepID=UPI001964153B|nr:YbaB/EbfC family nucleoid-associated protein [Glycomyces sp. YM15]
MSDRSRPNPEEMFARIEQMQRDAEETLRKYEEMQAQMGADPIEVYSEDGLLRVELDAEGKVAEIGIDEMAMRRRQSLAPMIIALLDEAAALHSVKMAEMAQALAGDKMDVMGMVRGSLPEHLRDRFDRDRGL